ncbi:MAG: glycosyltransferase family 39 protein [Actinobacteria bacterium]|nr:MAG: glycosyltransferase family 39 protein [Actinomycetota bacterium]
MSTGRFRRTRTLSLRVLIAAPQAVPRSFRLAVLALGVVGAVHGLVYVPFAGPRLGDTPSYTAPAQAIRNGSYSTPLPDVDVTALHIPESAQGALERQSYRTPGYPLLLAATGFSGPGRPYLLIVVQAILTGIGVALLALTARRLWGERAGLVAGALAALDPFPKHYVPRILSEALAGSLVALAVYAFVRAWQSRSAWWWAATGLSTAALTLTRPLFALAVPLVVLGALVVRSWRGAAACAAACALLLGPWIAWEGDVAGKLTVSSFGEGWNLLIAAHGEGLHHTAAEVERSRAYVHDFVSVHRFAPSAAALRRNHEAHPHYLARADAEQRRLAEHLYWKRLRHEPLTVLGEVAYRGYFLWMAHEDWVQPSWLLPLLRAADWLTLVLAALGVALAIRLGGAGRALALFMVVFTLVNAVHHVEARYAMPVRGLYVAFVGLALLTLWDRRQRRQEQRGDPEARAREVAGRDQVRLRQPEHEPGHDR